MSAPRSSARRVTAGVAVASTPGIAPAAWAISAAPRTSITSQVTFRRYTSTVRELIPSSYATISRGTRHRARRTAAQWRELIEWFERSGQSRGTFCAAHGLAPSTFDLWRRKLRATPVAVNEDPPEALFVELTSPTHTEASVTSAGTGAWEVELELGAGVVLRLRRAAPC